MKNNSNNKSGFVRIIILLILILLVASFMGYNPAEVWDNAIFPVISFVWKIIVFFVGMLITILKDAGQALANLVELIKGVLDKVKK